MGRVGKHWEVNLRSPCEHSLYLGMPQVCNFLLCAQWEEGSVYGVYLVEELSFYGAVHITRYNPMNAFLGKQCYS